MARKRGYIGNWQNTKYVSRETSGKLPLVPFTRFDYRQTMLGETSMPFNNVAYQVCYYQIGEQSMGDIKQWMAYNGGVVNTASHVNAYFRVGAYWWINDSIGPPEEWESGLAQNILYKDFINSSPLTFGFPSNSYDNGLEPLYAFTLDDVYLENEKFFKQGNQLVFSPQFDLYLKYGVMSTAPAPIWNYGIENYIDIGGVYEERGIWHGRLAFVYN